MDMAQFKTSPRQPRLPLQQRLGPAPRAASNRPRRSVFSPSQRRSPSPRKYGRNGTRPGPWRTVGRSPSPPRRYRYRASSSLERSPGRRYRSRSRSWSPSRRSRSRSPVRRTPAPPAAPAAPVPPARAASRAPLSTVSSQNGPVPRSPIRIPVVPSATVVPKPPLITAASQFQVAHAQAGLSNAILDHPKFCFKDGTVSFTVEKVKFRIHSYFLERDSIFFKNLLALPATGTDGSYVIQGLKGNEFESLLGFFYDGMYNFSPTAIALQTWINILSISTQFKFLKVREHAIAAMDAHLAASQLSPAMSPVEMLVIAEKHGIERWATLAYRQLCEREEPISQSEAEKIGLTSMVKVARDREQRLKGR